MLATTRGGGARRAPWGSADGPSGGLSGIGSRRFAPTWFRFGARSRPALRRMPARELASGRTALRGSARWRARPGGDSSPAARAHRQDMAPALLASWPANGGGGTDRLASVDARHGRRRSRGGGRTPSRSNRAQPLRDHDFAHCLGKLVSGPPDMLRPMGRRRGGRQSPHRAGCLSHGPARMAKGSAVARRAPARGQARRASRASGRAMQCIRAMRGPGDEPPGLSRRFRAGSRRRERPKWLAMLIEKSACLSPLVSADDARLRNSAARQHGR